MGLVGTPSTMSGPDVPPHAALADPRVSRDETMTKTRLARTIANTTLDLNA
jgi:hypothetical protein